MDYEKEKQRLFEQDQNDQISLYIPEIIEVLKKQTTKATINVREVQIEDIIEKRKDSTYLDNELLKITDIGINILYATDKVVALLKDKLPRVVKELTLPSEFLTDLTFLQEFPNLETLNISDYVTLSPEQLDFIEQNTPVKTLTLRSPNTINKVKCQPGYNVIEAGHTLAQHGKLTIFSKGYTDRWSKSLKFYTSDYNKQNIAILKALYAGINPYLDNISSIYIKKGLNDSIHGDFEALIEDGQVTKLRIEHVTPTDAAQVTKEIINGTAVKSAEIVLPNQTYGDIYQLKQLAQTTDFKIKYTNDSDSSTATYEEFLNMRTAIDYYKSLIEDSNLSPVEQLAYVYDILKTMSYKENPEHKERSRNIHAIVTDGTIVCAGYAAFAKQLLNELGIKCLNVGVTCIEENGQQGHHARNFVRVDDDKYNIHGLFAMDITWDSARDISVIEEDGKQIIVARPDEEMKKKMVDSYDSLALYRHFLIPMQTYEIRYPNEINPELYEMYKKVQARQLVEELRQMKSGEVSKSSFKNIVSINRHNQLFSEDEGPLVVNSYFNAPKPSLETFKQILANVRQAEGYHAEEVTAEVNRVVELHNMIANQNPDYPKQFFQPQKK